MTRQRRFPFEYPILACGLAMAMCHIVDFAFVHPGPGGTGDFVAAVVISAAILGSYPWLPVWWRVAVTAIFGAQAASQGYFGHVQHVIAGTAAGADYTGVLYLAGGTMILGLGIAVAVLHRRLGRASPAVPRHKRRSTGGSSKAAGLDRHPRAVRPP